MKREKVIIIGSKGMLGQSLVEIFVQDRKYFVIDYDIEEIDITNKEEVFEKIEKVKPNLIINAAAYNAVDKAEEKEEEFMKAKKINGNGPKFLAEVAKNKGAVFVHYSSDYVFDGKKGEYQENDSTNPISRYGFSKELGEKNVRKVGEKYYIIRTSKLFGKAGKTKNAKKSFFEMMLNLARENNKLRVIDDEKSCFTYTKDLAKATKKLIEAGFKFDTYHIVNEGAVTWYEGTLELLKVAGISDVQVIPINSNDFFRPAKRPKSSVLLNTKFPKLRNYQEALADWISHEN